MSRRIARLGALVMLAGALAGASGGLLAARGHGRAHRSAATLNFTGAGQAAGGRFLLGATSPNEIMSSLALLRTRSVADSVIARSPLRTVAPSHERGVEQYLRNIHAHLPPGSSVGTISFDSPDPALSRAVLQATLDVFLERSLHTRQRNAGSAATFLAEQIDVLERQLDTALASLVSFRSSHRVSGVESVLSASQQGGEALSARIAQLGVEREVLRRLQVDSSAGTFGFAPLTAADDPLLQSQLAVYLQRSAALDSMLAGPGARAETNPDVQRARTLLGVAGQNVQRAAAARAEMLDAEISAQRERLLRTTAEARSLPALLAEEEHLRARANTIARTLSLLRDELHRARAEAALVIPDVEVIDLPTLPREPIGWNPWLLAGIGGVGGLLGGFVVRRRLPQLQRSCHDARDVERLCGMTPLAVVPRIAADTGAEDAQLEPYRMLRTTLWLQPRRPPLRRLLVTSPLPGDGKSTTALQLARMFAHAGHRTLLIDADLRRPVLHHWLRTPRAPGLSDVAIGVECALHERDGMLFLPAGTAVPLAAELLASARIAQFLERLVQQADVVIIDAPPILSATDVAVISPYVDAVLLVLRAASTPHDAVRESLARLHAASVPVAGLLLNHAN